MESLHQDIQVRFRYPVHFTTDLFALDNPLFNESVRGTRTALFVLDEGMSRHHPRLPAAIEAYCGRYRLTLVGPPLMLPGGEGVKNEPDHLARLYRAIHDTGLCRHSYVVAVGGGAVLDLAGYATATAHRGLRLIRVPTTALAQNDSGVGVKTGVNAFGKKNFLGTFTPPDVVLNDSKFLVTLSDRDWRAGIAEAIKVALVKDASFFAFLEAQAGLLISRDTAAMQQLIYRCATLHLDHIARGGDPFESGSSRPLDFGHWAGHKLEQLTGYRLRHGEAVAVGIALDTTYSHLCGFLEEAAWQRVIDLLGAVGLALHVPELSDHLDEPEHPRCIFGALVEFREHLGGPLTILLLRGIGQAFEVHDIDHATMRDAIRLLRGVERRRMDSFKGEPLWREDPVLAR